MKNKFNLDGVALTSREAVRKILEELPLGVVDDCRNDVQIFPHLRIERNRHLVRHYKLVPVTEGRFKIRSYGDLPKEVRWRPDFCSDQIIYDKIVFNRRTYVFSLVSREEAQLH